ncbi:virulence factor MviN [Arcanobacterium haemolyticum]|nr:virulence factor MviN [Arcanobacterium haemolyticum]
MNKISASLAGAVGSIAALTLLSRLVGFVRTWVQNGALGDTAAGVAYSTSNTVPNVLFEVAAGGALAGAVIPVLSGFLAKGMKDELGRSASALLTWICVIGFPLAGIVALTAEPLTRALLGVDAPADQVALAAALLRMFALQIPLYGISVVLTGILQTHKRFILPALAPMLSSLTVIATFLLFSRLAEGHQDDPGALSSAAISELGWGTTLGVVAFSLPQLIPAARLVTLRPTLSFPTGVARRALSLMGAGLGGLLAQQVQIVVVMWVANTQGGSGATGAYPVYTFANAVYMVPYAVLAVPIATAVFPKLSEAAALPGRPELATLTARSTRLVMDAGIVCVALLAVLALPAQLVFAALRPVAGMEVALVSMAPGLVGYALIYHCSRVLYAIEASKDVALVNALAWATVCVVLGVEVGFGLDGRDEILRAIGIAISVGMSLGAIGELWAIRRALGVQATGGFARSAILVTAGMALVGSVGYGVVHLIVTLIGSSLVGGLVSALAGGLVVLAGGVGVVLLVDRKAFALASRRG